MKLNKNQQKILEAITKYYEDSNLETVVDETIFLQEDEGLLHSTYGDNEEISMDLKVTLNNLRQIYFLYQIRVTIPETKDVLVLKEKEHRKVEELLFDIRNNDFDSFYSYMVDRYCLFEILYYIVYDEEILEEHNNDIDIIYQYITDYSPLPDTVEVIFEYNKTKK